MWLEARALAEEWGCLLALYDDLRDNRLGKNIRLEQEHIGFGWVESALAALRGGLKATGQ